MNLYKKIALSLLILPLLFVAASFSHQAHAAITQTLTVKFVDDYNFNGSGGAVDPCATGSFSYSITDSIGTTNKTTTNCSSQNIVRLNNSTTEYSLKLLNNTGKVNYTEIVKSDGTIVRKNVPINNPIVIPGGAKTVYIAYNPFCSEADNTGCKKCNSNAECSPRGDSYKYCVQSTGKCSDVATYKDSLCKQNNFCGNVTVQGFTLSCGNTCSSSQTCNSSTHKCVIATPAPQYVVVVKSYLDTDKDSVNDATEECQGGVKAEIRKTGSSTLKQTITTKCNGDSAFYRSTDKSNSIRVTPPEGYKVTGLKIAGNANQTLPNQVSGTTIGNTSVFVGLQKTDDPNGGTDTTTACDAKTPGIVVTDPTNKTRSGLPGAERQYTLKITNRDSGTCDPKTMVLSKEKMPSDSWKGSFSTNNFSLAKGASKEVVFKVTSPDGATTGEKNISVGVKKQGGNLVTQALIYIVTPKNPTSAPSKAPTSGQTACNRNNPEVTLTQDKTAVKPGGKITYTAVIKNKDTGSCAAKNLALSTTLPNTNWSSTFSDKSLSLAINASKTITIGVTSPSSASIGTKDVKLVVKNSSGTALVTKALPFSVAADPATVTKAPTSSPTACQRKAPTAVVTQDKNAVKPDGNIVYSVTLTNNDTEACADKKLKLSATMPNDSWKATFSKNDLSMKAGTKIAFTLTVDSPNFSTPGTKVVKLVVKNSEGTALLTQPLSFIISETPASVTPPITPPITDGVTPPSGQAVLNFVLGLDGIGTTERINIGGNKTPQQTEKGLTFQLRNPLTNAIVFDSGITPFGYDSGKEKFTNSFTLPTSVDNGTYNVYVFGAPYISRRYPTSVSVTKGQATNLNSPQFYMVAGNIDDEGQSKDYIDIRDYNVLMSCSIFSKDSAACDSNPSFLLFSDLNSDGLVDQSDYTLWLKEKSKQKGDLPE